MDAGDIWAAETFAMPSVHLTRKSSLYRNEVTEAAVSAVLHVIERFATGNFRPQPLDYSRSDVRGRLHAPMRQADRAIDWKTDDTRTVLKKSTQPMDFPACSISCAARRGICLMHTPKNI